VQAPLSLKKNKIKLYNLAGIIIKPRGKHWANAVPTVSNFRLQRLLQEEEDDCKSGQ
jgi:hypothetical protein